MRDLNLAEKLEEMADDNPLSVIPKNTPHEQLFKALKPILEGLVGEAELSQEACLERIEKYFSLNKAEAKALRKDFKALCKREKAPKKDEKVTREPVVENITPWEAPVEGYHLLDDVFDILKNYVVLDHHSLIAGTLWTALSYVYDCFRVLPLLAITSPEKRCGKTTLLEVLSGLVNKPLLASNITPSAVFRTIEKHRPCLLIDEADTFLGDNEELRGLINSGHTRKSAFVIRTNPNTLEVERFPTWGPKALSLIGDMPDTLRDRSISLRMERKLVSEKTDKVSLDFDEGNLSLRRQLKRWAVDNAKRLKTVLPELPEMGNDRALDNWFPLFGVALIAGGDWPDKARKAMLATENISDVASMRQNLLTDLKAIFDERDKISSKELVKELIAIEDHPWADWAKGRPLTQNGLARLLRPFGIISKTIRIDTGTAKGYELKQFAEAFKRYLTPTPPLQSVTTSQVTSDVGLREFQSVTQGDDVTFANRRKVTPVGRCDVVTVEKGVGAGKEKNKLPGCTYYQQTGDCRAAYEIELMSMPVRPGLEGIGCLGLQTSGRCLAADGIEELMTEDALSISLNEEQGDLWP